MSKAYLEACKAQGMRCGHIDGKGRVGVYIMGEEFLVERRELRQGLANLAGEDAWADGYYAGYRWGAEGKELPDAIKSAPLPDEVCDQ